MTAPLVEANGLVKQFNGFTAVDHIDFSVLTGECFGFLGPNGAGKTSTIRMIQCLSPVTGGALTVAGKFVGTDDREIKALMGVVPQDDNLDEDLTVIQNLKIYASYFDIPPAAAMERGLELLKFLHLEDRADARLRSLSGGMRRRLIIARALINNPRLLILDEPTTGLDPQARHVIWQKIRSLKDQGVTILLTTHYMEEAERLCDRIAIMDQGRILLEGPPRALVEEGVPSDVIEFRPRGDEAEEAAARIECDETRLERAGDTFVFFTAKPYEVLQELRKLDNYLLAHRRATLEDLFLRATGRALRE